MSSSQHRRRRSSSFVVGPTEPLQLGCGGLSLHPRLKLLLSLYRADFAVRPVDEWRLRQALLNFLRSNPLMLTIPDDDLVIRRRPDLHKLKRGEAVGDGKLYVRDLEFLKGKDGEELELEEKEKKFIEWRKVVLEKLQGLELNIEGAKFNLSVEIPDSDDFDKMKKSWEDHYASQLLDRRKLSKARRPDTFIVRGVPSRWFAETRVSSNPSQLVTHTIFSVLGNIRNLKVAGDDDPGKNSDEHGEFLSGLNCKIWVQFESYEDFCNAMKVLCGRSLQKEGSQLKVDYEVGWERDDLFRTVQQRQINSHIQERNTRLQLPAGHSRSETQRHHLDVQLDHAPRSKRFRE